jgi:type II secretory ATPase GspE/PulE/Tfp pilus assembly ATPase PilB-like protein
VSTFEDQLLEKGLITSARLQQANSDARKSRSALADVLLRQKLVQEEDVLQVFAETQGIAYIELRERDIPNDVIARLSAKFAAHYQIVPVGFQGGSLTVAVCNALDMSVVEDIQTATGYSVERVLACRDDVQEALRRYYGVGADTVERILAESGATDADIDVQEESHDLELMAEDTSVVRLVNQLLHEAIANRATDIHFEVYRDGLVLRRRVDGILFDTAVPQNIRLLYPSIVSRIKLMSGLNIVERRMPQDGRARVTIGDAQFDLRVSIVPSIHGEDIVIRILPAAMIFDLPELGYGEAHVKELRTLIDVPHGIIFVTGPTGSGKSTTLYACLSELNTRDRKIITIEDPVEYELRGITQTQINLKVGLTFAHALRSMLRHDPDVMLVGEVRDRETAEIAIQTAMTGHLVLSSLHTNDAAGGAARLIDMGIDPYLITSTVRAFIAQRLVRLICAKCKEPYERDGQTLYRGAGCRTCHQSGFRGRMAICEFLPLTPPVREMILAKQSAKDIRERADALGLRTMAADGWEKVALGMTTAEEVLRVTSA